MNRKTCIHRWRIDEQDIGTCIRCGEIKNFHRLQNKEGIGLFRQKYLSTAAAEREQRLKKGVSNDRGQTEMVSD
ncbi:hypothetical protein ES708_20419 [subsurface metagenome]